MVDWTKRAYCRNCEKYRMTDTLLLNSAGRKICPVCHFLIRTIPRNASSRQRREQKLIRRIP